MSVRLTFSMLLLASIIILLIFIGLSLNKPINFANPSNMPSDLISMRLGIIDPASFMPSYLLDSSTLVTVPLSNAPSKVYGTWDSITNIPLLIWSDEDGSISSITLDGHGSLSQLDGQFRMLLAWRNKMYMRKDNIIYAADIKINDGHLDERLFANIDLLKHYVVPAESVGNIIAVGDFGNYILIATERNLFIDAYMCMPNQVVRADGVHEKRVAKSKLGLHNSIYYLVNTKKGKDAGRYLHFNSESGCVVEQVKKVLFDLVPISDKPLLLFDFENVIWASSGSLYDLVTGNTLKATKKYVINSDSNVVPDGGKVGFGNNESVIIVWYGERTLVAESYSLK